MVAHRPFIDLSIVLYWSQLPILFLDEEERRCIRGDGRSNIRLDQLFVNEVVKGLVFSAGHGVDGAVDGVRGSLLEIDCVIPGS